MSWAPSAGSDSSSLALTLILARHPDPVVALARCPKVDIGDLDARVVNEAIGKAGGDQAGIMSVTKGVQAAAACM